MLHALIFLVIACLVLWLIYWFLVKWVGIPEPGVTVAKVVLGGIALLLLIDFLWGLAGHPRYLNW